MGTDQARGPENTQVLRHSPAVRLVLWASSVVDAGASNSVSKIALVRPMTAASAPLVAVPPWSHSVATPFGGYRNTAFEQRADPGPMRPECEPRV